MELSVCHSPLSYPKHGIPLLPPNNNSKFNTQFSDKTVLARKQLNFEQSIVESEDELNNSSSSNRNLEDKPISTPIVNQSLAWDYPNMRRTHEEEENLDQSEE